MGQLFFCMLVLSAATGPNESAAGSIGQDFHITKADIDRIEEESGVSARGGMVRIVECEGAYGYSTIQSAIDASSDGDVVVVLPNECEADGKWHENLNLFAKSIRLQSANPESEEIVLSTVIDGGTGARTIQSTTATSGISQCQIDGLFLTGGATTIFLSRVDLALKNCLASRIGGIFVSSYGQLGSESQLKMENCSVTEFSNSLFLNVQYCNVDARNCQFVNTTSRFANFSGGNIQLRDLILKNNQVGSLFRLCSFENTISAEIENCTFVGNRGGNVCVMAVHFTGWPQNQFVIRNCFFGGNWAEGHGCIYSSHEPLRFENCTIVGNRGLNGPAIYAPSMGAIVTNCVFRDNRKYTGQSFDFSQTNMTVTYSSFLSSLIPSGVGNTGAVPLFAEPGYWDDHGTLTSFQDDTFVLGDYHLLPGSPCIDAGDPAYEPAEGETDLDGNPRVLGCYVDMGAYEAPRGAPGSGDFDGDAVVDFNDVMSFVESLLIGGGGACVADLNGDGLSNGSDLELFVETMLG